MTSVTAVTLAFVLIVLTPALIPYITLRIFFPRARVLRPSDGTVVAIACLLGILANGTLLASLLARFSASKASSYAFSSSWLWRRLTEDFLDYEPFRPGLWLFREYLIPRADDLNLLATLADLHLRPLFLGLAFVLLLRLVPAFFDAMESAREGNGEGLWPRLSRTRVPREASEVVDWARAIAHHPWQYLTSSNRRHELTMVDVLTYEGSLYSGKLEDWLPDGDGLAALTITRVLRFYPAQTNEERTRAFVPNKGELVIPKAEIRTAHIWRIKKGSTFSVPIRKHSDIERVKWLLTLDFEHPEYFSAIDLHVLLSGDDRQAFESALTLWGEQVGITPSARVSVVDEPVPESASRTGDPRSKYL